MTKEKTSAPQLLEAQTEQLNIKKLECDCLEIARFAGKFLDDNFKKAISAEKMGNLPEGVDRSIFNIVTNVDLELQRQVAKKLLEKYPTFEFYGEENPEIAFDKEKDADIIKQIKSNSSRYQFIVDPLDGTGRHAKGDARHGFFLGLLEDKKFIFCVGYNPKQDTMTHAIRGGGCFRNNKPFRFDSTVDDHLIINSKAIKIPELIESLRSIAPNNMVPKHTGTMYDMLFFQYAQTMISLKTNTHDHPLSLAVEEAGGVVLVFDGNRFVKAEEFNWRSAESKKDANIQAYIASNSEENAQKAASIVRKFIG